MPRADKLNLKFQLVLTLIAMLIAAALLDSSASR